jgi:IS5 family transposase
MLRMYFLQQWFGLADEALEDAIYDSQSMRDFVGIDLARESVPDATTLLKFRRLLEQHQLTAKLFEGINALHPRLRDFIRAAGRQHGVAVHDHHRLTQGRLAHATRCRR